MRIGALGGEVLPKLSQGQAPKPPPVTLYLDQGPVHLSDWAPSSKGRKGILRVLGSHEYPPSPGSGLNTQGGCLPFSAGNSLAAFACQGLPGELTTPHQPSLGHWQD